MTHTGQRKILHTAGAVILIAAAAFSQVKSIDVVDIQTKSSMKEVKGGFEVSAEVRLSIKSGWHINAHEPLDKYLIPTIVLFDSSREYSVKKITYPPSEMTKLPFSDDQLALYVDQAVIKAVLYIPQWSRKDSLMVTGKVQYQPCNDQTCLSPVKKTFTAVIRSTTK